MNWPMLYARSRGLPAAAAALLVTAALLGAAVAAGDGATDPRLIALAVTAGVTAAAPDSAARTPTWTVRRRSAGGPGGRRTWC